MNFFNKIFKINIIVKQSTFFLNKIKIGSTKLYKERIIKNLNSKNIK